MVATVRACDQSNRTGLQVTRGEHYRIVSAPDQRWVDWFIPTDADGFRLPLLECLMRLHAHQKPLPAEKWLALCGRVDDGRSPPFLIGKAGALVVDADGELRLFANDARGYYGNNRGAIEVTISREQ